jgi:hypothetical protein
MNNTALTRYASAVAALTLWVGSTVESQAHARTFAYSYGASPITKGEIEIEQWATWKNYENRDRFEFRTEIEFGLTERDQLSVYLSDWRYTRLDDGDSEAEWRTAGVAWVHNFLDPAKDGIGLSSYLETLIGPEKFVLEGKILAQKNFGPVTVVYNGILEAEWEGSGYDEEVGVIENTLGVNYQINPSFGLGLEALHEVEFAEWSEASDNAVYVGPSAYFRSGMFFTTLAGLWQATDVDGEPDFQLRVISGIEF